MAGSRLGGTWPDWVFHSGVLPMHSETHPERGVSTTQVTQFLAFKLAE